MKIYMACRITYGGHKKVVRPSQRAQREHYTHSYISWNSRTAEYRSLFRMDKESLEFDFMLQIISPRQKYLTRQSLITLRPRSALPSPLSRR